MERDDLEPPRAGGIAPRTIVLLAALALALAALLAIALVRTAGVHRAAEQEARDFKVPALEGVRTPSAAVSSVSVIAGDTRFGASTSRFWSRVASGTGADLDVSVTASGWPAAVQRDAVRISDSTALLVLVPGGGDAGDDPIRLATALTKAVAGAREEAPRAVVLLVVPPGPRDGGDRLADVVRSSAALSDSRFLDLRSPTSAVTEEQATADAADRLAAAMGAALR